MSEVRILSARARIFCVMTGATVREEKKRKKKDNLARRGEPPHADDMSIEKLLDPPNNRNCTLLSTMIIEYSEMGKLVSALGNCQIFSIASEGIRNAT